jgi:hypothetical protein
MNGNHAAPHGSENLTFCFLFRGTDSASFRRFLSTRPLPAFAILAPNRSRRLRPKDETCHRAPIDLHWLPPSRLGSAAATEADLLKAATGKQIENSLLRRALRCGDGCA